MEKHRGRERELTIREVAAELGTDAYGVFLLINAGELKANRFGGHYRVTPSELRKYRKLKLIGEGKDGGMDEA